METKKCTKCGEVKSFSEFHKRSAAKDGKCPHCKECQKKMSRKYLDENKDRLREERKRRYHDNLEENRVKARLEYYKYKDDPSRKEKARRRVAKWRSDNPEKAKKSRDNGMIKYLENPENKKKAIIRSKKWAEKNKDRVNALARDRNKNRRENDPVYNLKIKLRNRIRRAFKDGGYTKKSNTINILGCKWNTAKNHIESQFTEGMSWENQGDWHIDHIIPLASANTKEELIKLNHYKNLQPLWAEDNFCKGDSMPPFCVEYKVRQAIG